jgi:hypothetical protein
MMPRCVPPPKAVLPAVTVMCSASGTASRTMPSNRVSSSSVTSRRVPIGRTTLANSSPSSVTGRVSRPSSSRLLIPSAKRAAAPAKTVRRRRTARRTSRA